MLSALLMSAALVVATEEAPLRLRFESVESLTLLRIESLAAPGEANVRREGREIVVRLPASAAAGLSMPMPVAPVENLRLSSRGDQLELHIECPASVGLEVRRESNALVLVLGGASPAAVRPGLPELYRSLFPSGLLSEESAATSPTTDQEAEDAEGGASQDGGLNLGPFTMRPALLVSYVDGNNTIEGAQPVHDSYFQIEPQLGLGATLNLLSGRLRFAYEPRFRRSSSFEIVRRTTHEFDGSLEQPVGAAVKLRAAAHHTRGALEVAEVDPGREYFYELAGFRRWRYTAGARFETGGRFDLDVSANLHQVRFDEASYFFDYDDRGATAELGYDLTADLRAGLGYVYQQVPAQSVDRPEAASRSHALRLAIAGTLASMPAELTLAYQRRQHPQAEFSGQRFEGLVAGLRLTRELRPGVFLTANFDRFTTLSAFERNGYYVANRGELVATVPLPLRLSGRAGFGHQTNRYDTVASEIGVPRRDTLRAWTAGLGRSFSRWMYARVDYRAERRDSNLDALDNRTHTLVAQIGLGWMGGAAGESR